MAKFLHHATIIYLAGIILLRMMAMPISLLEFSINKTYIAENICENRQKPDIHCGGQCFLNKKLAKASDTEDSQSSRGNNKVQLTDFFEPIVQLSFSQPVASVGDWHLQNSPFKLHLLLDAAIRPPITLSRFSL